MRKHYDLTRPPKFILNIFARFRKWKLSRYKNKKVRQEKSIADRDYFVKFKILVNDPINPQSSEFEYEMVVPAKAAFFAKRKTEDVIKSKIEIEFVECEPMSEIQYEEFEESKEEYEKSIAV